MITPLNKLLSQTLGVNIVRARPRRRVDLNGLRKVETPMYVEFVGVPGVGKTTLFKHVLDKLEDNWLKLEQFRKRFPPLVDYKTTDSLSFYQEVAAHSMQTVLSSEYNALDKMRFITHFHSVILKDSLVSLHNEYKFISDEGLFHNCSESVLAVAERNKDAFKELIKNRVLIYCYASAETVANRVVEREKRTGDLLPQYKHASYEDLLKAVNKDLEKAQKLINTLAGYTIPILSVNTENAIADNVREVKEFVEGNVKS